MLEWLQGKLESQMPEIRGTPLKPPRNYQIDNSPHKTRRFCHSICRQAGTEPFEEPVSASVVPDQSQGISQLRDELPSVDLSPSTRGRHQSSQGSSPGGPFSLALSSPSLGQKSSPCTLRSLPRTKRPLNGIVVNQMWEAQAPTPKHGPSSSIETEKLIQCLVKSPTRLRKQALLEILCSSEPSSGKISLRDEAASKLPDVYGTGALPPRPRWKVFQASMRHPKESKKRVRRSVVFAVDDLMPPSSLFSARRKPQAFEALHLPPIVSRDHHRN